VENFYRINEQSSQAGEAGKRWLTIKPGTEKPMAAQKKALSRGGKKTKIAKPEDQLYTENFTRQ